MHLCSAVAIYSFTRVLSRYAWGGINYLVLTMLLLLRQGGGVGMSSASGFCRSPDRVKHYCTPICIGIFQIEESQRLTQICWCCWLGRAFGLRYHAVCTLHVTTVKLGAGAGRYLAPLSLLFGRGVGGGAAEDIAGALRALWRQKCGFLFPYPEAA